ncbi:MAG TPA: glycosyltransferase [Planctomycetota bacterium]|nr:glycosyltransferase [Planctomycetota bacterium]
MTRALVVAYYYPPKGGAGTQRFAKFCKYLPGFGVDPTVISASVDLHDRNAPNDDATLVADSAAPVIRVGKPASAPFAYRLRRMLRLALDEDEWAMAAGERALAVAKEQRATVVVTTLSPWAGYRIGERLQRESGLPWVLDLRDPWALDGWRSYRSRWHARADLAHMRRAVTRADFVVANVPEARLAYIGLGADPARTVVIPNGFDAEDFAVQLESAREPGERFRLVHMGTFHPADTAEGTTADGLLRCRHRQIAPLGRTGYYLLHAVALLQRRSPATYANLAVHLYGAVDATHRALVEQLGIGEAVHFHGYVPHRESTAALDRAHAVFVPLHGVPTGERALVVPGKLYEALASERPVLAALPPGDGADLVRHLAAGVVVAPTDADGLAQAVAGMVERRAGGRAMAGCTRDRIAVFERRHLTGLLANVLRAAEARARHVDLEDPWQALGVCRGNETPPDPALLRRSAVLESP